MGMESSPEAPQPVRVVLNAVGGWIGRLGRIWVEGQIAELNRRGRMAYITLRDPVANVSVRVVCQTSVLDAQQPPPEAGARVVVHAKPDFYEVRGTFSLRALEIRHVGLGELLARLEQLRRTLQAEGLFAPERKRPLPFLPGTVGLICGRDSAAERDVLENSRRRWPAVRFEVRQVAVQGDRAVREVVDALKDLDSRPEVDVIVIARGGGSLEDLLPFSDEAMVRAVAAARTPVVSAIGHEQDAPLLDHVADLRASTPTDAAKKTVPDVGEQLEIIRQLRDRGRRVLAGALERESAWLASMRSRPALADPVREIDRLTEQVLDLRERSRRNLAVSLDRAAENLGHTRARLHALSPATTLARGYAIVQRADGTVVRSAAEPDLGETLRVRFAEGGLAVTVDAVETDPETADETADSTGGEE
ncbi:exodeoxyribonuclease VII large subunit [Nocardiopsis changdeensis]|uniref:Exodeoxyribonuclease 7 large subunit n=1 Tax=Nocardiopsis changdeensis TaxID=2831969 RepID=A0ABX8BKG6_9ACTN|nr:MULTISPECIES: exodeoxyribonuclease VII large subunit [Nocardiopsis]QUX21993.1 exodeoxyribonuclease VII large subunit [Nocardiopsis changdeensis]QYX37930.1 exodeoxyribonuclease VII large subunit [Nocardiopsis sp. MT53]